MECDFWTAAVSKVSGISLIFVRLFAIGGLWTCDQQGIQFHSRLEPKQNLLTNGTNQMAAWPHYFVEWMVLRLGIVLRGESNGQTKKFWQGWCKHGSSSSMRPRYLLLIRSLGYVTCCILYMERNGAYLRSCAPTLLGEMEGQGHGKFYFARDIITFSLVTRCCHLGNRVRCVFGERKTW
jgi:hypothetical protein